MKNLKIGDIIKFKQTSGKNQIPGSYKLSSNLGKTCGDCSIIYTENKGEILNTDENNSLVKYTCDDGRIGILEFPNNDLELLESPVINQYQIF